MTHPVESINVGDRVELIEYGHMTPSGDLLRLSRGTARRIDGSTIIVEWDDHENNPYSNGWRMAAGALRCLPAPVETYGEQPSELPLSLPAGTTWKTKDMPEGGYSLGEVSLRDGHQWSGQRAHMDTWVHAQSIDWTTVPKTKPSPQPERGEVIPSDVAELLREARCEFPGAVVSTCVAGGFVALWREGCTRGFCVRRTGTGPIPYQRGFTAHGGSAAPIELTQALARKEAWPRADAERLARGEQPVPIVEYLPPSGEGFRRAIDDAERAIVKAVAGQMVPMKPSQPDAGQGVWGITREAPPMVARHSGPDPYQQHQVLMIHNRDFHDWINKEDAVAAARISRHRESATEESRSSHPAAWPSGACDDVNELTVF